MKRTDFCFALAIVAIFLPFVLCSPLYEWYKEFNAAHGMMMSFFKFGILSTMGEMLGCRISTGNYVTPTFGILPRMIVWGLLGMGINMAMIIFSKGTPMFMEYMGMKDAVNSFTAAAFTMDKLWVALAVSVAMNTIFAPVFMTFHKITDAHIAAHGGSLKALVIPIPRQNVSLPSTGRHSGDSYSRKPFPFSGIRPIPSPSFCRQNNGFFLLPF